MAKALSGRRALVVGGGSGIGLATARLLADDGADVTIAGRTVPKLEEAGAAIGASWVACDVLRGDEVAAAVGAAAGGSDTLDIAVTVPGGGSVRRVVDHDDDGFSAEVDANVRPAFLVIKHAARAMTGGGSIVVVSSTAAVFSTPMLSSYAAGKAAVDHLVRVAADELGAAGVRVNAVRPGLTRTAATAGMFADPDLLAAFLAQQPLARHGEPDDVARAIRWLAGPESSWVTGQCLAVDGGHTLRRFPSLG